MALLNEVASRSLEWLFKPLTATSVLKKKEKLFQQKHTKSSQTTK